MKTALVLMLLVFSSSLFAGVEVHEFGSPEDEARYRVLTEELRCLVCQNQNLADSNADLAKDLRREVYKMVRSGQSNKQIKSFLVDRYGDFVLYNPPFKISTAALWIGPAILLIGGFILMLRIVSKRKNIVLDKLSDADRQRAKDMLQDNKG